jgi:peptide/nickel transport system substrate-binding protein
MLSKIKFGLTVGLITFLLVTANLLYAAPTGKVVFLNGQTFETTGGDALTGRGAGATTIKALLHEGLVVMGMDGKYKPAIAKSWSLDKKWANMTFLLNEKARFHDGSPVTAQDVKFSLERAMRPEMKFIFGAEMTRLIDKIETEGDYKVIVYFKMPYPAFLARCAEYLAIEPKKYIEKVGDAEYARKPVGAGPFKFVKLEQDVSLELEAVDNHYRKVPAIKTLVYKVVPEPMTRLAMLKTGEADITLLDPAHMEELRKDKNFQIYLSRQTYLLTLAFDDLYFPQPSPFKDIRVRQAVSYALDREAICKNVLFGASEPWGDIYPPYMLGYDPKIKEYPYDPVKAKALLKEAGYPNGFETEISAYATQRLAAETIAAELAQFGIKAKLNILEFATWTQMMRGRQLKGLGFRSGPWWGGRNHPGVALESHFAKGQNYAYYVPEEIAKAMEQINHLTDEKEIFSEARKISALYRKNMHRINLWAVGAVFGLGPKIQYWQNTPGWVFPARFEEITLKR